MGILSFLGAGNDWIAYGIKQLTPLIRVNHFFHEESGTIYKMLLDHHQLRWLADGVYRMSIGGIMNALWDLGTV